MVKGVKWDTTGRRPSGRLDVMEIDVNPLMVHANGQGATALDALVVTT